MLREAGDGTLVRPSVVGDLQRWLVLVTEWNARTDLTAARDADELADLFVADAAAITVESERLALLGPATWVDVGAGAGAPGLAIALIAGVSVTLVEPKEKRVAFLRSVLGELDVTTAEVVRGRAEGLGAGTFDVAVSRATLPPTTWLREGSRLSRRAVWVLLARDEAPALDGWSIAADRRYTLPLTGAARRAVCYVPVS